jgi:hypothetical protein
LRGGTQTPDQALFGWPAFAPAILVSKEGPTTTLSQFSQHERVSSALTTLMGLAIIAALASWLVLLPY